MKLMELLRHYEVDLMRYLPKFLANDPTFLGTQNTLSAEHEAYRLKLIDIMKQFFVETVTWGIDDWEELYGVIPEEGDTLKIRRARVAQKIRGVGTVTVKVMNTLINSVVPTKDATFRDNIEDGVVRIDMETAINLDKVREVVDFYKPAHLTCLIVLVVKRDFTIHMGAWASSKETIHIDPAESDVLISLKPGKVYMGGSLYTREKWRIK